MMSSLYCAHFRLEETPFSIAPDPRFVYMSEHHREALGHLLYGLGEGGGFVQLTGEVGTGKTTICRTLLCQLPDNVDVALIFNPKLTVLELLQTICEELHIEPAGYDTSTKVYVDRLYAYLLDANTRGRRTILIIDEAQGLSRDVLEQIRLLTNLETNENKLLQIFLIGQPELRSLLVRDDLRQLAQRITARYHLEPLSRAETKHYIRHRLAVTGCERQLFSTTAVRIIFRLTGGVPRLINSLCDRALLGAYSTDRESVNARIVRRAHRELHGASLPRWAFTMRYAALGCATAAVLVAGILATDTGQGLLSNLIVRGPNLIARSNLVAANPGAREGLVDKARTPPAVDAKKHEPGAIESTQPAVVATLFPAEDASIALVSPATYEIDPVVNRPPVQEGAERSAKSDSSEPDAAESELLAVQRQHRASTRRTLGEHLEALGSDASFAAEQRLFSLWGIPETPVGGDLCAQAADRGLVCFTKSGSWNKLRGFDLPALLSLRRDGGEPVRALLVGLAGQDATLYLGRQQLTFRLHEVERYWTHHFTLLWKPPLERVTLIHPSHFGAPVQWLRTLFTRVDGVEVEVGNVASFDAELGERVKYFQRRRGLYADGIVGPETLIHLSTVIRDPDKPTLSAATVSAAQRVEPTVAYLRE